MPLVRFKSSFTVPKLLLNPDTSYELNCKDSALEIRLSNAGGSDPIVRPTEDRTVQLDICRTIDVTEKRTTLLRELEAKILSADDCPKPNESGVYTSDSPAKTHTIKFEVVANPLQTLYREIGDIWIPTASQTLRLLRWRYRKWSHYWLTSKLGCRWENYATQNWFRFPSYLPAPAGIGRIESGMSYHESVKSFLEDEINADRFEPIGHSLLQQAFELSDARGRIVLAVSAVEIGIKALIGERVPDAEWLAFNLPMPPVEKIVQEYIGQLFPDISEEDFGLTFPKDVLQALRKYVSLRNAIAHKGQDADSVDAWKTCDCMRDVLYRLDYLAGHKWAKGCWKSPADYGTNEGVKMTPHSTVTLRADIRG